MATNSSRTKSTGPVLWNAAIIVGKIHGSGKSKRKRLGPLSMLTTKTVNEFLIG
ncbi:hypothetical protein YC2023_120131 [Brassica napus]